MQSQAPTAEGGTSDEWWAGPVPLPTNVAQRLPYLWTLLAASQLRWGLWHTWLPLRLCLLCKSNGKQQH